MGTSPGLLSKGTATASRDGALATVGVARATAIQFKEAFVTVNVDATPSQELTRPAVADLFVHAAAQIHRTAAEIWPGEPAHLLHHVPSVTGYVHRVCVGDRVLYAKTSFLGASLVSLLRGTHGSWPDIRRAQEAYVRRPDSLFRARSGAPDDLRA
ncbi:hypothetical protein ACL07V_30410 [Streptomyces sp. MB22_4]|uniref:hypothetical protein n=1 Tax=Streptomyces sp. MB22_4 TaxID=3383120 RepID=UPI00399F1DBD